MTASMILCPAVALALGLLVGRRRHQEIDHLSVLHHVRWPPPVFLVRFLVMLLIPSTPRPNEPTAAPPLVGGLALTVISLGLVARLDCRAGLHIAGTRR